MAMSDAQGSPPQLAELELGTLDCVHCGLCLSHCPTYRVTGRETSSPRGRVYLMRGVAEGRIPLGAAVAEEASLCLGCRACETACPSGVQFGSLLEQTRAAVSDAGLRSGLAARLERLALRQLVPRGLRLHVFVAALAWVQRLRLDRLALLLLPPRFREIHALLPPVPPVSQRRPLPRSFPARGEPRGRVALFEGCLMPELFGAVNRATAEVLSQQGFEVVVPAGQGCCGALQAHSGDLEFAKGLARSNVAALAPAIEGDAIDAVVVNSAGCGAVLRELDHWLGDEALPLAGRVRDVCEFLDEVGLRGPLEPLPLRVAYDDPCHLVHAQGVQEAPRRLLEAIPGLEIVSHEDPSACCGAAGTYNLTQPEMSRAVLTAKMDALASVAPDVIASGNPGCLMQLRAGAAERGLGARVLHPIQLLAQSLAR
ncbi:MAG: hypothetical protein CL910_19860 [Deltaproteobacteria bacterium]|jgi:glycolate oxidase iron-sulfur subunit|nr:hypothetical protein [Deltaproteobacteria bacterium]